MSFRVPYLVGNKLTRDHQMWPLTDGPIVAAAQILTVNLAILMQMAWRVREWTVTSGTMSYSWHSIPSDLGSPIFSVSGSWNEFTMKMTRLTGPPDVTYRDVTDERDILGPSSDTPFLVYRPEHGDHVEIWKTLRNAGVLGRIAGTWTSPNLPDFFGDVSGTIFGGIGTFDPARKVFAPPFGINGIAQRAGAHPSISFFAISVNELAANPGWNSGGALTVIDPAGGPDLVMPIAILGQDVFDLGGTGTVSDITMTPTKWWKFKNSLGQDVYDEGSGAQVNDPFL